MCGKEFRKLRMVLMAKELARKILKVRCFPNYIEIDKKPGLFTGFSIF